MRKGNAVLAAFAALAACAALAGPAMAADQTVTVGAGGDRFGPAAVTINQGDTITWSWRDSGHNVYSNAGQSETFRSEYLSNGGTFQKTFTQTGTFSYVCQPHAGDGMRGTVTVNAAPPGTPPPGGGGGTPPGGGGGGGGGTPGDPSPGPGGGPGGAGNPTVDSQPPTVSRLVARSAKRMTTLRFRSSEKARVSVAIQRLRRGRSAVVVKRLRTTAKPGMNQLRTRRLAPGRYRVVLTARDSAGNRSAPKTKGFKVR
jgi:plastocyanin